MPMGFSLPEDFYWKLHSSGSGCDYRIDNRLYEEEKRVTVGTITMKVKNKEQEYRRVETCMHLTSRENFPSGVGLWKMTYQIGVMSIMHCL